MPNVFDTSHLVLDVSNQYLSAGIYFLTIENEESKATKKFAVFQP